MRLRTLAFLSLTCLFPTSVFSSSSCPPKGYTNEQLLQIRQYGFEIESADQRNELAVALLECMAEPDPDIRDGIAFEGLSKWLRAQSLTPESVAALYAGLIGQIQSQDDPNGFQQPFAALILSEVVRTDRVESWLTDQQRAELVGVTANYLSGIKDYRGFSETEGWRHGVAHGSDLVLQLVLNDQINAGQIAILVDSVASQVAPAGAVFYTYGEPGRLARAIFYAHRRGELESSKWDSWFQALADPAPFESWTAMYTSQAGLAKRHKTLAFLQARYINTSSSDDARTKELEQIVLGVLERVLGG